MSYSPVEGGGLQRTELYCHECDKTFIAEINYDISGNHIVECPHCGHEHCRVVREGKITADRWEQRNHTVRVPAKRVWKSKNIPARTSTVAYFIREQWLNRSDFNGL